MAEAAGGQATPSFKLVLVGDGGTGKVCPTSVQQHFQLDTVQEAVEALSSRLENSDMFSFHFWIRCILRWILIC